MLLRNILLITCTLLVILGQGIIVVAEVDWGEVLLASEDWVKERFSYYSADHVFDIFRLSGYDYYDNCGGCEEGFECKNGACKQLCNTKSCSDIECGTIEDGCGTKIICAGCSVGFECVNNRCVDTCQDACPQERVTRCAGRYIQTCGNFDADPCLEWDHATQCPRAGESCIGSSCQQLCTDECLSDACSGDKLLPCGNVDGDSCLEYAPAESCPGTSTCSGGKCMCTPQPCSGRCGPVNDGCGAIKNCGGCGDGEECTGNQCVVVPKSEVFDACGGLTSDCASFKACDACPVQSAREASVSGCKTLSQSGTTYRLSRDVSTAKTCFVIQGSGITLDCDGHTITYGTSNGEAGVLVQDSSEVNIQNCKFKQTALGVLEAFAVSLKKSNFVSVKGNTIETKGGSGEGVSGSGGIVIRESGCNKIVQNTIRTDGKNSYPILALRCSNYNTISENTISTFETGAVGLYYSGGTSSGGLVERNTITTQGSSSSGIICARCSKSVFNGNHIETTGNYVDAFAMYYANDNSGSGNTITSLGANGNALIIADGSSRNVFTNSHLSAGGKNVYYRKAGTGNSVT